MPVVVNRETDKAENLDFDTATKGLHSGLYELPILNPEGELGTIPFSDWEVYLKQGYRQAGREHLQKLLDEANYTSPGQQVKTAIEGAAQGAVPFGLSTLFETEVLGEDPEDIRKREEFNPGVHLGFEIGGLGASAVIPGGQARLLSKAGKAAAKVVGLGEAASTMGKIGSSAVRNAIEGAILASNDEASHVFMKDPNQTVETALTHVGLNGLLAGSVIGAGMGAVPALWKMSAGPKAQAILESVTNKANGIVEEDIQKVANASRIAGIPIDPSIQASISSNRKARDLSKQLAQGDTIAAKQHIQKLANLRELGNEAILEAVGKTAEDIERLKGISFYEEGVKAKSVLNDELKAIIDPLSREFEEVKAKYSKLDLSQVEIQSLGERLATIAEEFKLLEGNKSKGVVERVIKSLGNAKILSDFTELSSQIADETAEPALWRVGGLLKAAFREAESDIVLERLAASNPKLAKKHANARAGYAVLMDHIDSLDNRLKVGKYVGPGSFLKLLEEVTPETFLKKMTPLADVELSKLLSETLPGTAQAIRETYLNRALKKAGENPYPGQAINPTPFFSVLKNWSPELKEFILPERASETLGGIEQLIKGIPESMNPSGSAKTINMLWRKYPGGALALVNLLTGHDPIAGLVLGQVGKAIVTEGDDAIKLAMLSFLGQSKPIDSAAFKAMVDLANGTIRGQRLTSHAVKAVFKASLQVIPEHLVPKEKDIEKLKKRIEKIEEDSSSLLNIGKDLNHYGPEYASAMSESSMRVFKYLQSMKPNTSKLGPLGEKRIPNKTEEAAYKRALMIAEQALMTVKWLKEGTLTPIDVVSLKIMYPSFYNNIVQKMTNEMIKKGEGIKYQTKLSLARFLGIPLDATMTPKAIQMTQPKPQQQEQTPQNFPSKSGGKSDLGKIKSNLQTPGQSREQVRQAR